MKQPIRLKRFMVLHEDMVVRLMTLEEAQQEAIESAEQEDDGYFVVEVQETTHLLPAKASLKPFPGVR